MDLAGEYTFDAPQDLVWEAVQDPDVLGSVMPGGEGVVEIGENEYQTRLKIKVGPVQGKFKGKIKLSNIIAPTSYDIAVDGKGSPGFVKATGNLALTGQGDTTLCTYAGKARIGGRMASVGQRLVDASAKAIVNQSLDALNAYLKVQVERRAIEAAAAAAPEPAPAVEATPVAAVVADAIADAEEAVATAKQAVADTTLAQTTAEAVVKTETVVAEVAST
ncbi:MAG: SRPBCC family protein, partial [Candidatus Promineifilaceae bacterium]